MKNILLTFLIIHCNILFSQNNWQEFSNEDVLLMSINETRDYAIEDFNFDVVWDSTLSYSENIGYYGGISKLRISKKDILLQEINNIEDNIALGYISFHFYDYNFDGYLDFTVPINERWEMYFIFNPQTNTFEHQEDWDYLSIQKIDFKNKRILSQPDGNYEKSEKMYQVKGVSLIEIE